MLDANILVRAVLGRRVRELLVTYSTAGDFFSPDFAFDEARRHLPRILANRGLPSEAGLALLESLSGAIQIVDVESYGVFEEIARQRLLHRDIDDWRYTAIFKPLQEGGINVLIPTIPEICTYGETVMEAREMVRDAIRCYLESALETGEPIAVGFCLSSPARSSPRPARYPGVSG